MKFKKKPIVVEAFQLPAEDENVHDLVAWLQARGEHTLEPGPDGTLLIDTLEGTMKGQPGDWIICGVQGEMYPCKPDIFDATYEPVLEA